MIAHANYLVPTGANTPPLLTEQGVQRVLDYLHEKKSLPIKATALASLNALEKQLQELRHEKDAIRAFVVRHSDNPLQSGSYHMTPVYIQKRNGITRALVLDSKGSDNAHYAFFVYKKIIENLNTCPYVFRTLRQPCAYRCSIYSVRDLVAISKRPSIFDEIEATGSCNPAGKLRANFFSMLPPSYPDMSVEAPKKFDKYIHLISGKPADNAGFP